MWIDENEIENYRKQFGSLTFQAWYSLHQDSQPSSLSDFDDDDDDDDDDDYYEDNNKNNDDDNLEYIDYSQNPDFYHFIFDIRDNMLQAFQPRLHQLMYKQFPVFKKEERPAVIEHIRKIPLKFGRKMFIDLYEILVDQRNGVNAREKYPNFDHLVKIYGTTEEPKRDLTPPDFLNPDYIDQWYKDIEEEEKEEEEEERDALFYQWETKRTNEFMELVSSVAFEHYPELQELEGDSWILYAIILREEFVMFTILCENVEILIDNGYPEEYLKLSYEEYLEKISETMRQNNYQPSPLRERRIRGEEI